MDINKVTLIGRLTHKPEAKTVPSGKPCASFSVATNYVWTDRHTKVEKDKTEFHLVVVWGKLAEITLDYLEKGSRIYLEGRLVHRAWEDRDGQKRKSTEVVADEIIMLGSKPADKPASEEEEEDEQDLVVEEV